MRDEFSLEQKLEAMLCVALEPISTEELADVVETDAQDVLATLGALRQEFADDRRGFQVVELASGWVMQSSPDVAQWVAKFANRDVSHRLSSAALETLAIIAYRQPILYATTESFLDRMGLATVFDLPPIEEFMPPVATANEIVDEMSLVADLVEDI